METPNRQRWPRLTLILPPEAAADLATLARDNLRDRQREALRLLLDGIARETARAASRAKRP